MPAVHSTGTEPDTHSFAPQPGIQAVAEGALRSGPYPALKNLSCDYRGGVLVLRGCLPSYYLKQIAQEVVAHQVKGVGRLENQIQVVQAAVLEVARDRVERDVLDTDAGLEQGRRDTSPDSGRGTGTGVKIMAAYGEEVEVDA
jgi:hypothetical protein